MGVQERGQERRPGQPQGGQQDAEPERSGQRQWAQETGEGRNGATGPGDQRGAAPPWPGLPGGRQAPPLACCAGASLAPPRSDVQRASARAVLAWPASSPPPALGLLNSYVPFMAQSHCHLLRGPSQPYGARATAPYPQTGHTSFAGAHASQRQGSGGKRVPTLREPAEPWSQCSPVTAQALKAPPAQDPLDMTASSLPMATPAMV